MTATTEALGVGALNLDLIEARCEKAAPGPWASIVGRGGYAQAGPNGSLFFDVHGLAGVTLTSDDALFIAAARSDIPALIAEVRRLRATYEPVEAAQ